MTQYRYYAEYNDFLQGYDIVERTNKKLDDGAPVTNLVATIYDESKIQGFTDYLNENGGLIKVN